MADFNFNFNSSGYNCVDNAYFLQSNVTYYYYYEKNKLHCNPALYTERQLQNNGK